MFEKTRKELLRELRRRRVINSTLLYLLVAFAAHHGATRAIAASGIPEFAIRYVWAAALLLFPLLLIFAWHYDVTLRGIRRNAPETFPDDTRLFGADHVLIGALAVIALAVIAVTVAMVLQA